jgi:ubiquinone/menaquinone biosynthesis C-methylase UbiE
MTPTATDKVFAGSIPALYESHLVPLIFQPYAADLAERVAERVVSRVLEIAAGTGVLTRALDQALGDGVAIVATDLNPAMLAQARAMGTRRAVDWRPADAMALPFPDASFDCVVCQFGVMFFPDKPRALAEARRVLAPGGVLLFNAWDRIEENEFADVVTDALAALFPADPPRFMARTPHGYHERAAIARDVKSAGFAEPEVETLAARSRARSARDVAIAYCQGTPLRSEIEARGSLEEATNAAAHALERRFGAGAVDGKIQAHVVTAGRGA